MKRWMLAALLPIATLAIAADAALPTRKWVGPVVPMPDGQCSTVIYYGPWKCSQALFDECTAQCGRKNHKSMGCIWIADIKVDCAGKILAFVPTRYGGRDAITHCCCDYPAVNDGDERRNAWKNGRDSFRAEWSKEFGSWPREDESFWPGHHIFDLGHGGSPMGKANVLPVPTDIHNLLNKAYPKCYAGESEWGTSGPNLPYLDD